MDREAGGPSAEHERGVRAAENWVRSEGYRLMPLEEIEGSRPDVYGEKSLPENKVRKMLVEVETADSLSASQSYDQMESFAKWAGEHQSRRAVLFVPEDSLAEARRQLPRYTEYRTY